MKCSSCAVTGDEACSCDVRNMPEVCQHHAADPDGWGDWIRAMSQHATGPPPPAEPMAVRIQRVAPCPHRSEKPDSGCGCWTCGIGLGYPYRGRVSLQDCLDCQAGRPPTGGRDEIRAGAGADRKIS